MKKIFSWRFYSGIGGQAALVLFIILILTTEARPQYVWNFSYITDKTTHWRHLASGDTVAIARLRFSKTVVTDPTEYRLTNFGTRPITNHINFGEQIIELTLQLWMDDGDTKFNPADSLLLTIDPLGIPPQEVPTFAVSTATDVVLQDNQIFFIVAAMPDWRDDDPENIEIDESPSGLGDVWFSIVDSLSDLTVTPEVSKGINPYTVKYFPIRAQNLPVTVRNIAPTSAEDDSTKLNMFYPKFLPRTGSTAAKSQRLDDQSFTAAVYLPNAFSDSSHYLESAEFDFGFDNTILELTSLELGDVWGANAFFYVSDTLYALDEAISGTPNYTVYHFAATLNNALTDTTTVRFFKSDTATLALMNFKLLKPGVSPIFLRNEDIRDQYGIRYHTYRALQNYATAELSPTMERFDAWVKITPGDWTRSTSGAKAGLDDFGDGRVTIEDITLFSNYIWLNSADSDWYRRFDIGSSASHDPDEIIPDDTTNFYDLMVVAKNYNRTNHGAFNQKIAVGRLPHYVELARISDQQFELRISDSGDLNALHACLHFDPQSTTLVNVKAVPGSGGAPLLLYPPEAARNGTLDLNLFRLEGALGSDNRVILFDLHSQTGNIPDLWLDSLAIFGSDWEEKTYRFGTISENGAVPAGFDLLNCYPNPFNSATRIEYFIPAGITEPVRLNIYDLQGHQLKTLVDQLLEPGRYSCIWEGADENGRQLSSGLYFLQMTARGWQRTKKIILLR